MMLSIVHEGGPTSWDLDSTSFLFIKVTSSHKENLEEKQIIEGFSTGDITQDQYSYNNGIIKRGNQIYVGTTGELRTKNISEHHDTGIGGHSGRYTTYHKITRFFFWPNMKKDVKTFLRECDIYVKRVKPRMSLILGCYNHYIS